MKRVYLLDNQDSFTYNLAHYLEDLGAIVEVERYNDRTLLRCAKVDAIVLSPGPGLPNEHKGLLELISNFWDRKPMLGVCLGLQALLEFSGAKLSNLSTVKHGVSELAKFTVPDDLFFGIENSIDVGLYHSWGVQVKDVPQCWQELANWNDWVMAAKHKKLPLYGVQFHPESVLTPKGKKLLANWLRTL